MPERYPKLKFRVTFRQLGAGGCSDHTELEAMDESDAIYQAREKLFIKRWCDEVGTSVLVEAIGEDSGV